MIPAWVPSLDVQQLYKPILHSQLKIQYIDVSNIALYGHHRKLVSLSLFLLPQFLFQSLLLEIGEEYFLYFHVLPDFIKITEISNIFPLWGQRDNGSKFVTPVDLIWKIRCSTLADRAG